MVGLINHVNILDNIRVYGIFYSDGDRFLIEFKVELIDGWIDQNEGDETERILVSLIKIKKIVEVSLQFYFRWGKNWVQVVCACVV